MLKLPIKKSRIRQSFKWKKQTIHGTCLARLRKQSTLSSQQEHLRSAKRFRRKLSNFHEGPTGQLNEIFLNPQESNLEQNIADNLQLFEEPRTPMEDFSLAPHAPAGSSTKKTWTST